MSEERNEFDNDLRDWVDEHEDELVQLVEGLVRYPSVSEPLDASSVHPFGDACAELADATQGMVEGLGLTWENHDYYAVSAGYLGDSDIEDGAVTSAASVAPARPRIAFFSHLDVVPAQPVGWRRHPFEPYASDGYIYGRGSADNKGPFASVLFALRFLKERGIKLDHDVILYGGFNEEGDMDDIKWLVKHEPRPAASLVSDCSFPVCAAEKAIVDVEATWQLDDDAIVSIEAGEAHNIVPSHARAALRGSAGAAVLEEEGVSTHVAFPEGSVNALVKLAARLADAEELQPESRAAFAFVANSFAAFDGSGLGIALHDDFLGDTTAIPTRLSYEEGALYLSVNVRHPDIAGKEHIGDKLRSVFEEAGFTIASLEESPGRSVPVDDPTVKLLTSIVNDELADDLEPYAMGGATHARWIPGALGFGPGRRDVPLPAGAGSGHQVNEAQSIEQLKQAIIVYVKAILALDSRA